MKLYFVRHGQTNYNRLGILNDDPEVNVHLTNKGKKQVAQTAQELRNTELTHIYSSQLPRAVETAKIINAYHKLQIKLDSRLNENRTGYNGKPWFFRWVTFKLSHRPFTKKFRGAESLQESQLRVVAFLDEIKQRHPDDSVLIVGHANTGWIIGGYVNNYSIEETFRGHIPNGQVQQYEL